MSPEYGFRVPKGLGRIWALNTILLRCVENIDLKVLSHTLALPKKTTPPNYRIFLSLPRSN